ncbi:Glutathione import ATP-binding protein GsiA,dipeptide transporter ATP-binding subunit,ABC-type oligopeptide transport system, ATPase component,nickel import ATP-binding protein NikE,ABC transporter [Chlamydia poikilotherma]|uniref:Glutathione import ATP-binding protein GsiA,dipeptide transporter ATP-binding subunit,ABC-type oligopeptide transport system, ATPase component,nickel import ATP-binding protein NikE,ABC transporter n=1 Tax=Chlamydia poikilotherma TaxID=1967783 RepID=A0A3B0QGU2_9CHLA|nr:ABC transporter ATP-binding protein [Chlamydia poikilotherma]SYX09074.1 Glutathione import ATP-binding protein GsiA,dipeptide transporter ATP-binding subunit,ABC-type oligopeptide transport system, ATPase component,nickel import ATP-binding protein NikE,ABC transporter [Chlamydia poikilotherma]
MTNLVTINNLSIAIRKQVILNNINLQLKKGECLTIVGASGSGKSSLALAILGLMQPNQGTITFHVDPKTPKAKTVQIVWQDVHSSLNPTMSIEDLILEPLHIIGTYSKEEQKEKIQRVLQLVNLPLSVLRLKPHKLSGGQKQRVAIAKALVCEPDLLICDEPISALDTLNHSLILDLFQTIKQQCESTLLFITHDMSAAYYIADTIAVLDKGSLVEYSPRDKIFLNPKHEKTQELLDAIPIFSLENTECNSSYSPQEKAFV